MSGGGDDKVKDTEAEKELARIATEKMMLFDKELAPVENLYMEKVNEIKSQGQKDYLAGRAAQSTEQAFSKVGDRIVKQNMERGINPNSASFRSDLADVTDEKAKSSGESQVLSEITQEDEYIQGLNNIVAMGSGQSSTAQQGATRLASMANQKAAMDSENAWAEKANRLDTAGSVAGAAAWWKNQPKPKTAPTTP